MCNCKNITPQSEECYAQMIVVDIPAHMSKYRADRAKNNLSTSICIDPCIIDEIKHLWSKGVITYGCCCGHNSGDSFVNVDESSINKMLKLGYIANHPNKNRKDTYKLKSVDN